jgi:hypothetical protein
VSRSRGSNSLAVDASDVLFLAELIEFSLVIEVSAGIAMRRLAQTGVYILTNLATVTLEKSKIG